MFKYWLEKLKESFISTAPILCVVFILYLLQQFAFSNDYSNYAISHENMSNFAVCSILIVIGLAIFNVGAETSMSQIGKIVGDTITHKKNIFFLVAMTFILGVCVTVAEPDLNVLAAQIGISKWLLIGGISIGVGIFLVVGVLRVIFNLNLNTLFIVFYAFVFALANLVDKRFLPLCFDAGGVTTGPVTVPFILAFGLGIAATKSGGKDSFGFTALASVGPIVCVMILSLFSDIPDTYDTSIFTDILDKDFAFAIADSFLTSMKDVALAILPIVAFFLLYNFLFVKLPKNKIGSILFGLIYTYVGLTIFLSAVQGGFQPVAIKVGQYFGSAGDSLLGTTILFAFLFGLFGVLAEPAVHILVKEVEEISEGIISKTVILIALALSIGLAVSLHVIRCYYNFSIMYYLVPGYMIALGLTFAVPKIFTAIAFDSGGVASGPMTSTFILPFCIGFASQVTPLGDASITVDVYQTGLGLVSMVALMPLIVLQALGLYGNFKKSLLYSKARERLVDENDNQIIHFEEVL